ncbi:hypothetical protein K7711_23135 [Nocardia sp. CA2R105]|uniref:hypothetical protein n=1 Tax=Nocardia coffeae TaxID=2873381 RepID=UPI001CA68905|nr:hypothetical protein [Nocardia coffeae]MBY8859382.1 hypothetical protein [Nocardia coffeae]
MDKAVEDEIITRNADTVEPATSESADEGPSGDENVSATTTERETRGDADRPITAKPLRANDSEQADSADAESFSDATAQHRSGIDRGAMIRRWPAAAAAVVIVTLAIATVWSVLQFRGDAALSDADREVGPAAADAAAAVLSYEPDTVAADLARAHSHLTGDFATYFDKLGSEVVIPAANARHMSSTATVTATSVVSADSEHAVALVFVNQVTTADDLKQPTTMSSSLRLELVKIGEHWLVDKLDTV